jgi:hypothetical protein
LVTDDPEDLGWTPDYETQGQEMPAGTSPTTAGGSDETDRGENPDAY